MKTPSERGKGAPRPTATARVRARVQRPLEAVERFAAGDFAPTIYIEGLSEALKAALLAELRHAWRGHVPEAPLARVFRAAETSVEELLAATQGASLFSPRELAIVLEAEDLGRSEKRVVALAEGLSRGSGASCLVLVESAGDTVRKSLETLRAACEVQIEAQPPRRAELLRWGKVRLAREKIEAEAGAIEAVADASEGDALAFFSELEKLAAATTPGGTLALEQVQALLAPVVGADIPDFLAAVAVGQSTVAAQRLNRLLVAGVGEGAILFALSTLVGGALGGWGRYRELSAELRRRSSPRALGRALDAVYRAESAWKTGRADVIAVLEQATREVSAAG